MAVRILTVAVNKPAYWWVPNISNFYFIWSFAYWRNVWTWFVFK